MVFSCLVQAHSPLELGACKDLLTQQTIPLILRIFKPLVFANLLQILVYSTMANIWGSAFDVSTFSFQPIILFVRLYLINPVT